MSSQLQPPLGQFPSWNSPPPQQSQLPVPAPPPFYGTPTATSLPPPPWDANQPETSPPPNPQHPFSMQQNLGGGEQYLSPYGQPIPVASQPGPTTHLAVIPQNQPNSGGERYMTPYGQPMPVANQPGPVMPPMYPPHMYGNAMPAYGYGYGYGNPQGTQYLEHHMYGLSVRDDTGLRNSHQAPATSSYVPPAKPPKQEDKLFGDLVDIAKFKQPKPGRSGSM